MYTPIALFSNDTRHHHFECFAKTNDDKHKNDNEKIK